jgi:hypothetical protein
MSDLKRVEAAVGRWAGRLDADAAVHVDKPTVVTVKLAPGAQPEVTAVHEDGSEEEKDEDAKPYGTPVSDGVTPFGESGNQARQAQGDQARGDQADTSGDEGKAQDTGTMDASGGINEGITGPSSGTGPARTGYEPDEPADPDEPESPGPSRMP